MAEKDLYEDLCNFYEFILGPLPRREEFKQNLPNLVTEEDLSIFFLLPISGPITMKKLAKKAKMPSDELNKKLDRLASEGFVLAYEGQEGPTYERLEVSYMSEFQVRKKEDTPQRTFYAKFFNNYLEGNRTGGLTTKTPGFRVLPDEASLKAEMKSRAISVNAVIPDPQQVLSLDVISEVIKREEKWIGVAECYCRKTKQLIDEGCGHPLETCLVFNETAQWLIKAGVARKIDYEEAMGIARQCEEQGLVHQADNCEENIRAICNCCPCCCGALKMHERGAINVTAPSRYVAAFDENKCELLDDCISCCPTHARYIQNERMVINTDLCIGCGLCVTACPQGANSMVPREKPFKIPRTRKKLYNKMGREALLGIAKKKILRTKEGAGEI